LVRYADDLAVFCPTQEEAIEAKDLLAQWLRGQGLRLSDAKTHIRHLTEGFNFLGSLNLSRFVVGRSGRSP
jgi:RNA-directed DNA polymerase